MFRCSSIQFDFAFPSYYLMPVNSVQATIAREQAVNPRLRIHGALAGESF